MRSYIDLANLCPKVGSSRTRWRLFFCGSAAPSQESIRYLSRGSDAKPSRAGFLAGAALLSTAGRGWMLSGGRLNERPSALRRCPRTGAPSSLRSSATRTRKLSENMAMTPAVDPGKTYVDLVMKGIELLLAELSNTGQKN